jgi:hypothetical protein
MEFSVIVLRSYLYTSEGSILKKAWFMSRVIFVNEAVNALYRVAGSGELRSRVGATRAVLMRVGRRGAEGPGAVGPGYYFTLETVLEGSGVETPGTGVEEEANFPTSARGEGGTTKRYLRSAKVGKSISLRLPGE